MDDDRDRDLTVHQRYSGKMGDNKGIRDAGSTADFRILFEIFEIFTKN